MDITTTKQNLQYLIEDYKGPADGYLVFFTRLKEQVPRPRFCFAYTL